MTRYRRPSPQTAKLLVALADAGGWRHGYELMKATGLSSGTLYPILMRLTESGLLEAEWREPSQTGRPARHAYRLTAKGVALSETVARGSRALTGLSWA